MHNQKEYYLEQEEDTQMRKMLTIWLAKGLRPTDIYDVRRALMNQADRKLEVKFGLQPAELAK